MAPVLHLLAPLIPSYVSRPGPEQMPAQHADRAGRGEEQQHDFQPCVLEAIVTVDAKGRVPLAAKNRGAGSVATSVTIVGEGTIEIAIGDIVEGGMWAFDARGRLQLHDGVLRASGIDRGERLAVVWLEHPPRVVLTSLGSLAVRRGAR